MEATSEVRDQSVDRRPSAETPARSGSNAPGAPAAERRPAAEETRPAAEEMRPAGDARAKPSVAEEERKERETRRGRRPVIIALVAVVALLIIAGGVYYYISGLGVQSTDDAFTDGRAISIAPQVAGQVVSLDVTDNEFVRERQPIVHIDPRQYIIARNQAQATLDSAKAQAKTAQIAVAIAQKNYPALLQQAQAQLRTAQANLVNTQANYERQTHLNSLATSQQQVDAAVAAYHQAQGQVLQAQAQIAQANVVSQRIETAEAQYQQQQALVEQAQAQLDQAKLNLSYAIVTAPQDGWITNRTVNKGDYLTTGQQIVSIVSPQIWITANFKETQLDGMQPGDPVDIHVDAYPGLKLTGHVQSIEKGTGGVFSAFPPENATGNFVKVVQRVPVKILIDHGLDPKIPLPLGLSVEPTVHIQ